MSTSQKTALDRVARRGLSPFPEMLDLHRSLDRLLGGFPYGQADLATTAWQPPVDIFETETEIVIKMELPEVRKEDVQVNLEERTLTIRGVRRLENEDRRDGYHRIERFYGEFARSFTVPANINRDGLKASYKDGLLRVVLPKAEEARPRQISVE